MSMSQEEIEALMSGLDIEDDVVEAEESSVSVKVNTQEIEELLSQTEDYKKEEIKTKSKDEDVIKVNIDESKDIIEHKEESFVKTDEIEKLLNDIETSSLDNNEEDLEEESFDELEDLVSFEKEPVIEPIKVEVKEVEKEKDIPLKKQDSRSEDDIAKDWTSSRIEEGIFPLPAEKDTKVVNQLSQVANDSEEKVSQIFDVLSFALDNNNELRARIKNIEAFVVAQSKLLDSLNKRFPNINVFTEHLNSANDVSNSLNTLKLSTNDEDSKIFQAMELMQFNDINRQKIERVMSVIRKLSLYLNNLFEDDSGSKDIAVAKHIHGDSTDDLIGDDLDKLIAEFSNNK